MRLPCPREPSVSEPRHSARRTRQLRTVPRSSSTLRKHTETSCAHRHTHTGGRHVRASRGRLFSPVAEARRWQGRAPLSPRLRTDIGAENERLTAQILGRKTVPLWTSWTQSEATAVNQVHVPHWSIPCPRHKRSHCLSLNETGGRSELFKRVAKSSPENQQLQP